MPTVGCRTPGIHTPCGALALRRSKRKSQPFNHQNQMFTKDAAGDIILSTILHEAYLYMKYPHTQRNRPGDLDFFVTSPFTGPA